MKFLKESNCANCERTIDESRPACPNCGLWMEWGDRAVVAARGVRFQKFKEQEQKAERALLELRHNRQAHAGREPFLYRVRRDLYLAKLTTARPVGAAVVLTFALTVAGSWLLFGGHQNIRAEAKNPSASYREAAVPPTARCADGTNWFGATRRGACSGHGGVAQFYIRQDQ